MTRPSFAFLLVLSALLPTAACGGGDSGARGTATGGTSNGGANTGGTGAGTGGGTGGTAAGGGGTSNGGSGGGGASNTDSGTAALPRSSQSIVAGGVFAQSANFKAIVVLGEGPGGNRSAQSTTKRVNSGLVGRTQ